ncbi:S8 family peptidase [Blautia sp.]|uniref:S8 family peptidase n=1 Tax=Blautia sp. TaxID=1955243 RepID=UPI00280AC5CD|nr:S8 family peptidase [Blautia sp.]MED9882015.1 S8 family peptidase [Blautia sp.]
MLGKEDYEPGMEVFEKKKKETAVSKTEAAENQVLPAQDENYQNFIVRYNQNVNGTVTYESDRSFQIIDDLFGVTYVPSSQVPEPLISSYSYFSVPKCYTYMDQGGLDSSGVNRLHDHPYLKLRGAGNLIAIIDSGIDWRHEAFRNGNHTKILSIWDQSAKGSPSDGVPYGRIFTREDIDRALVSPDTMEVLPPLDANGHGTMLAGIAAGNRIPEQGFSGAAPEAELVVVKLKQAKKYLRELYLIPSSAEVFQEDDIMLAIAYAVKTALQYQMPLSVCIGLGSSMGAHRGEGPLSQYIGSVANFTQNAVSVAAGNEGLARHHYMGILNETNPRDTLELRVGSMESGSGFSMEFWGESPDFYNVVIQSPTGERLSISAALKNSTQELSFVFVETKVLVNYIPIERRSGNTLIFFRFLHPAEGIWKLETESRFNSPGRFHVWLPVQGMISEDTYFLEASPDYTITSPGDAPNGMTAAAYQYRDNSLYIRSSRGYNTDNLVKPDFAAPGVDMKIPLTGPLGGYGTASGTSLAAAQTAGIAALLFEWAVIRGNEPFFFGNSVKNYLRRGAVREEDKVYPNREWGYGRVDLYHTFELLT